MVDMVTEMVIDLQKVVVMDLGICDVGIQLGTWCLCGDGVVGRRGSRRRELRIFGKGAIGEASSHPHSRP